MFKLPKKQVVAGIVTYPFVIKDYGNDMNGYVNRTFTPNHKVKVHLCNGVPVKINMLVKGILSNSTIYLDPSQYGRYIKLI